MFTGAFPDRVDRVRYSAYACWRARPGAVQQSVDDAASECVGDARLVSVPAQRDSIYTHPSMTETLNEVLGSLA